MRVDLARGGYEKALLRQVGRAGAQIHGAWRVGVSGADHAVGHHVGHPRGEARKEIKIVPVEP